MNIERLLEIVLEADKFGDYVTADKVTNLLKTAQANSDQQYNNIKTQYISNIISNANAWNSAYVRYKANPNQQDLATMNMIADKNANTFEAMKQDNRLTQEQKNMLKAEGTGHMNSINSKYESGQLQQTPQLQIVGGSGTAPVPYKDEQGQYPGLSATQQMPQQGGVYNPGMAPGATYYTPGVVNVAKPQMTEEQKAFADLRGTGIYNSLARSRGVMDQRLQAQAEAEKKAKQSRINYGPAATPRFLEGTNTQAEYVPNPNTPINPQLYGSGYASMAMAPQQPMPQQPQTQQSYQNYYNNAMMQQQQSFNPQPLQPQTQQPQQ